MEKQLVKINPADYGLEEKKAQQISDMFKPMLDKMVELESEYNEVIALEITKESCRKAKELRLKYVKIRTGTAEIHKELKQFYLQGGRFVDGWKNAQLMASQGLEEKLAAIENYFERQEAERIALLQEARKTELLKYTDENGFIPGNLGELTEEVWNNFLLGTKTAYELKKEAERKAVETELQRIKAEKEEQERIKKENERLQKEAIEKEAALEIERKKQAEILKKQQAKADAERKAVEAKLKAEQDKAKQDAEKAAAEKAKLEAELKAKADAERKAIEEEEAKRQAELAKGDADKIKDLINDLSALKTKYIFKSKKSQKMYSDVKILLDKVINHIKTN